MSEALPSARVTLPALDIRHDTKNPYSGAMGYLVSLHGDDVLLRSATEVIWLTGGVVNRKLTYGERIVAATFTVFKTPGKALAVILTERAHIYFVDGRSHIVSIPFPLRNAFPFAQGLILAREDSAMFYTLTDPLDDFGAVVSASTSAIAATEELVLFPRGLTCLGATYTAGSVTIYHVRQLVKPKKSVSKSSGKDEGGEKRFVLVSEHRLVSESHRLASESDSLPKLRKDIIMTRLDSLHVSGSRSNLHVFSVAYDTQEAVVIANSGSQEAQVVIFDTQSAVPCYSRVYTFRCLDCLALARACRPGYIVVLRDPATLCLVNPFLGLVSPDVRIGRYFLPIARLADSCGCDIAMIGANRKHYTLKLLVSHSDDLVRRSLLAVRYLGSDLTAEIVWLHWVCAMSLESGDWDAFVVTVLSLLPREVLDQVKANPQVRKLPHAYTLQSSFHTTHPLPEMLPRMLLALHLLREDAILDVTATHQVERLGFLLAQLSLWLGWSTWHTYYKQTPSLLDRRILYPCEQPLQTPPNLFASCVSLFLYGDIVPYTPFSQLTDESQDIDELITPRTFYVLRLFEVMISSEYPSHVIDLMVEFGFTAAYLETFPAGVSIPLKEFIARCRDDTPVNWTPGALELVSRKDLTTFLDPTVITKPSYPATATRDIHQILQSALDTETLAAWDGHSEAERINTTKLRFSEDRRFYEITRLLQSSRTQAATLFTTDTSDHELIEAQRELAALAALRTLTIPLGRSALFFSSRTPLMTEKFPIPKLNFDTTISPMMSTISVPVESLEESQYHWGYFHNGASAGLSVAQASGLSGPSISGSWIVFNKPVQLNPQHAGFLLGLGLNGHLQSLEEWHIYNYLGPKHTYTSVGLLLGMSASHRRLMDVKLTKVLSVHVVALLPPGANDLNVDIAVQTAGLVGIGLLYLESQHRRMSEVLLAQISGTVLHNDKEVVDESYRLAAGIALGYVNLGKGGDLRGLHDTYVADRLLAMAVSPRDFQAAQQYDKSAAGAILALAFIYMKTDSPVAAKLAAPETEQLLDYIRPDLLLLRCLGRNLINWSKIGCSREWVDSQIPLCLLQQYAVQTIGSLDSDQLAYLHLISGACLAMGLRYASTGSLKARDTLVYYMDALMALCTLPALTHDAKLAQRGVLSLLDLVALSMALVMAGTGDLETFRRLRFLQGRVSKDVGFGNYMAVNMALGLLFLGGGQYAIDSSNFAIAALVTALYPVFPKQNTEVHLQALRSFWALAVLPRCLTVRDVATGKSCQVPVQIELKSGKVVRLQSPCLLPSISDISRVKTASNEHFEVVIDLLNRQHEELFRKSLSLYVYRRDNSRMLRKSTDSLLSAYAQKSEENHGLMKLKVFDQFSELEKWSACGKLSVIDAKIEMANLVRAPKTVEDLWNVKLIFAFAERILSDDLHYLDTEFVEQLKLQVWSISNELK
ncbi:hypothetical protein BABINDRAFT_37114 [Babjeviella inositovora NRRL Y-12698]|uniref:Uncharacterized protein n=1 Tax=Babjeviella inositovora NRRL Y-12698 TaxID=984486 RepID=A0A1E3QRN7_9ASCO|nr:uncharacterized protein BABINDRAFT_37114 [Babjeviella inositovora NRRL Y-12698]ODQ79607.1 hypothetical protein BABINDRAFT_37114 [Babjeviella inositovora NRRL Y-12698]